MLDFILDDVKKTLDCFHNLTGLELSLYDEDMRAIYHTASSSAEYCRAMSEYVITREKCHSCDIAGLEKTRATRKTHIYKCHSGFTEAYVPICHNNLIIGYMQTGQILCRDDFEYTIKHAEMLEAECGFQKGKLTEIIKRTKQYERKYIENFVQIMEMCASYLYLSNIIKKKSYVLSDQLKEYIETHLNQDLSVGSICDKFYISKAKLYRLATDTFGMGISEYVVSRRIQAAKNLLVSTELSIYAIAEEVGFTEQNYFSRIFKKHTLLSPMEYRKLNTQATKTL